MKAKEIEVGGRYLAKVSGKSTTVRVDDIRQAQLYQGLRTVYIVTNLATGRTTTFRSAQRFRGVVRVSDPAYQRKQKSCPPSSG